VARFDQIHADDGVRDVVNCVSDRDTVFADPIDRLSGCEVNGKKALSGGVLATFSASGERFRVWVTNPQTIVGPPAVAEGREHGEHPQR
jgi:hypothetical protein